MFFDFSLYELQYIFGLLSMGICGVAFIPYIVDIRSGRCQPHRSSWLIWAVVSTLAFLSQAYEGADKSLLFAGVQAVGTVTIFFLSIKRGAGVVLNSYGTIRLIIVGAGLLLSFVFRSAGFTVGTCILIGSIAGSVTVSKAFAYPQSETMLKWGLQLVAAIFAILSIGRLDWMLIAIPLYLAALNAAVIVAMLLGRFSARHKQSTFGV